MDINLELYEFLKENETGMYLQGKEVVAYVHVYFFDLDDFVKAIGSHWFDEGGLNVQLFENTVAIDLNDIIEGYGHTLLTYKNCFEESDLRHYKRELEAMQ
jgi:hypothetical protein